MPEVTSDESFLSMDRTESVLTFGLALGIALVLDLSNKCNHLTRKLSIQSGLWSVMLGL